MKLEITITNGFLEYLKNFETADAAYLAAQDALFDHLDADDNQWDALKSVRDSAYSNRDDCAVVLARFLVTLVSCLADAPADALADVPVDSPADAPADALADVLVDSPADALVDSSVDASVDSPVDAPVDASVDSPADVPVDVPVKCLRCRYFGDPDPFDPEHRQPLRCCFVPDEDYDDMPCADTPADGNSRSPAPRARASPAR